MFIPANLALRQWAARLLFVARGAAKSTLLDVLQKFLHPLLFNSVSLPEAKSPADKVPVSASTGSPTEIALWTDFKGERNDVGSTSEKAQQDAAGTAPIC